MAIFSACVGLVCLLVLPASAGDKKADEQMTVAQMRVQTYRAQATRRGAIVRMKGGSSISGEVKEVNAQGFALKTGKSDMVWVDYSEVQTIKLAASFKYAMFNVVAAVLGAAVVGAILGLTAWVIILIVNS
jgi:hypothetical protein